MGKLILIIDDEPDILTIIKYRLEKAGYHIITAGDGEEGFDAVKKNKPDLVLLDMRIPKMIGVEVCKKIKSDTELKNIPVVFITASQRTHVAQITEKFGAQDFIIKPFEPEELLSKIRRLIG